VLRNPQARANYDRYGDPRGMAGSGGDPFAGFGDVSDLIETFFGAFGGGTRARSDNGAGRDAVMDVTLTLEEALTGVRREVETAMNRRCETCSGTGAAPGHGPTTCRGCGGRGVVQRVRSSVFGQMLTTAPCTECQGRGQVISDPCRDCGGEGRQHVAETIGVDVPPGIDDGRRLRLSGRGEAGRNGAAAGDLYVRVHVRPHDVFTRDGDDLHCELGLGMVPAALGTHLVLPTLDGEHELAIPGGTQSGDVLTIRRRGMPRLGGAGIQRGDLHVHCRVQTPTDLSPEQEDLLRQLADLRGEEVSTHGSAHKGFFSRLRDAFS
jgi:molecular chaperone DnaJ